MELTGTYRHTYMRNLQTGYTKFTFLPLEDVDGIDQYGNILCIGKIPLYSKGMPLKIQFNRRQTSSGHTYFILEHVEEYVAHDELSDMEPAETVTAHKAWVQNSKQIPDR